MSTSTPLPHSEPQDEELKPHGDELDTAVKTTSATHSTEQQTPAPSGTDPKE